MATISERLNREGQLIGWQVKVRKKGYPPQVRTFDKKADAQAWATVIESEMVRGVHVDRSKAERTTFREAIEDYIREVAPTHKGARDEILRLQRLLRDEPKLAAHSLAALTTRLFEEYRDRRLMTVVASTIPNSSHLAHASLSVMRVASALSSRRVIFAAQSS